MYFKQFQNLDNFIKKAVTADGNNTPINMPIPKTLERLLADLKSQGKRGLVVGGSVRDAVMGATPKDIDVEVYGITLDELWEFASQYGKAFISGKSFGVVKFRDEEGGEYDLSVPRRDSKMEGDPAQLSKIKGRGFTVTLDPNMSVEEAAARRDYTINSMAYDPLTGELYDYYNGVEDIKNKTLRATSSAFSEDPLRVLRGMQFAARFDMAVEPETAKMCAQLKNQELVKERVVEEWMKLFTKGTKPSKGLQFLVDTEWIDNYPELKAIVNLEQDPVHHPEGTVDIHTGLAMDAAAKLADADNIKGDDRAVIILGALCHDLGKAVTTERVFKNEREQITTYGHHEKGVELAKSLMKRMNIKQDIAKYVPPLVEHHMDHIWFQPTSKKLSVKNLAEKLFPASIKQLEYIIKSDHSSRPPLSDVLEDRALKMFDMAKEQNVYETKAANLITGDEIKEIYYGVKEGPLVGEIIKEIRAAQLRGNINTKEEALQMAEMIVKKHFAMIKKEDIFDLLGGVDGPHVGQVLNAAWEAQKNGEFSDFSEAHAWLYNYLETEMGLELNNSIIESSSIDDIIKYADYTYQFNREVINILADQYKPLKTPMNSHIWNAYSIWKDFDKYEDGYLYMIGEYEKAVNIALGAIPFEVDGKRVYVDENNLHYRFFDKDLFPDDYHGYFPIIVYVSAYEDPNTIGIAINEDGSIQLFEGNEEATNSTYILVNKIIGINATVTIYCMQEAELVRQIQETGIVPAGLYVSPDRKYAESHWSLEQGRILFTGSVRASEIRQESDVDWRTMVDAEIINMYIIG